jgi:hypothetical protein
MLIYAVIVQIFLTPSVLDLLLFASTALIMLPALSYLLSLLRLHQSMLLWSFFILYALALTAVRVAAGTMRDWPSFILFNLLQVVPGGGSYVLLKSHIRHIDWPITRLDFKIFQIVISTLRNPF